MTDIPITGFRRAGARVLSALVSAASWVRPRQECVERHVLILEPFGMGDVLSLQPLVRLLYHHGWTVDLCARESWKPLFPDGMVRSWIPAQVPWTAYDARKKYDIRAYGAPDFLRTWRALRAHAGFSIGFDPRGDVRSVGLLVAAGFHLVVTFSRYLGTDLPVGVRGVSVIPADFSIPRWQLNLRFLDWCGIRSTHPPRPSLNHLTRMSGAVEKGDRVALIAISPWPGRRWPVSHWQKLAAALRHTGKEVCALCGPGQFVETQAAVGGSVDVQECPSIQEWVVQLVYASLVIAIDSGPAHLADALGKRLIVLCGPGHIGLWGPTGPRSCVVHHQDRTPCAPCHQEAFRCHAACMAAISVEEVLAACARLEGKT